MLLRNLSNKVQADIERTNRGEEKPERGAASPGVKGGEPAKDRANPRSSRSGAIDPAQLDSLSDTFFTDMVSNQDNISEQKRHDSGYTHVSDLIRGLCARKVRLSDESDTPIFESPTGGHRVMWLIGRAVEKHIRDSYIKAIKGKGVLGKWLCKCGQTEYAGLFEPHHRACPFCRTAPSEYNEITLSDHEAGVRGNPDILVFIGKDGKLHVVEIKSMNQEEFDELAVAKPDHVYQGASYRRLLVKNGYDVADEIIIVYCTKKFMFGRPYKEFHPDVSIESIENVLDGMWARAELIRESRIAGTLPGRTECSSPDSPQAKKCQHVTDCFSRS